LTIVKIP